jgi:hypothetical protein
MTTAAADPLVEDLVAQLQATREAERDLFGALDPAVRDGPLRPGDWSPKDHQAHLTAWKEVQANRIHAARLGEPIPTDTREDDEINAELQAKRADWSWDAIAAEADEVSERLESEIRAAGSTVLNKIERLVAGIFGNGPFHAITHFGWLRDADIGVEESRVIAFVDTIEQLLDTSGLPDADRGVGLYNLACAHAVAGRLDRARSLLRVAFRLRPDLAEYAKEDTDLVELREELAGLVA